MLCRVCGDRPQWPPASMAGWPPALRPSLILQTCTSLGSPPWPTASQKDLAPHLPPHFPILSPVSFLFLKSSSALLYFHFFLALRSPLFDFLILTFSLHPIPSLQAFLSPSGSRQRLTLPIPKVSHAVRLQGTTHTLCPHHWHTTHIQTRPGHPCED